MRRWTRVSSLQWRKQLEKPGKSHAAGSIDNHAAGVILRTRACHLLTKTLYKKTVARLSCRFSCDRLLERVAARKQPLVERVFPRRGTY